MRTARDRIDHLRKEAEAVLSAQPLALEVVEELQTTMAEPEAAEDELIQQYDEILSNRNAVEYERARYQDLFEFAPDAYIVTSKEGRIIEANRAACSLLRVRPQFIVGKQLASYIYDQDLRAFRSELNDLAGASDVREIELRISPRKGGPVDASLRIGPVRDAGGQIVALRWLIRDITERKQAEERVRKLNEELERRVRER
ncbi:MAG TPA: PAS domain-containing protein, partial [Blastocatellia bacterium]|nr:PAS domain-containing protein [Blastocatellia bacterium]